MRPLSPPRTVRIFSDGTPGGVAIVIAPVRMLAINSVRDTRADGINGIELSGIIRSGLGALREPGRPGPRRRRAGGY
jgi:hypothetical protein